MEELLASGSEVNAFPSEEDGRTALQAGAEGGYLEIVEKVLAVGSDVNADDGCNRCGSTALEAAAGNGHLEIMVRLLTAGAKIKSLAWSYRNHTDLVVEAELGKNLEIWTSYWLQRPT